MDHPTPPPQTWLQQLEDYRQRIDKLDGSLIATLAKRFRLTEKIGQLKATHSVQATDSDREHEQREHFRKLASLHGLDEEIALDIMTRIIEHVKARHDALKQEV